MPLKSSSTMELRPTPVDGAPRLPSLHQPSTRTSSVDDPRSWRSMPQQARDEKSEYEDRSRVPKSPPGIPERSHTNSTQPPGKMCIAFLCNDVSSDVSSFALKPLQRARVNEGGNNITGGSHSTAEKSGSNATERNAFTNATNTATAHKATDPGSNTMPSSSSVVHNFKWDWKTKPKKDGTENVPVPPVRPPCISRCLERSSARTRSSASAKAALLSPKRPTATQGIRRVGAVGAVDARAERPGKIFAQQVTKGATEDSREADAPRGWRLVNVKTSPIQATTTMPEEGNGGEAGVERQTLAIPVGLVNSKSTSSLSATNSTPNTIPSAARAVEGTTVSRATTSNTTSTLEKRKRVTAADDVDAASSSAASHPKKHRLATHDKVQVAGDTVEDPIIVKDTTPDPPPASVEKGSGDPRYVGSTFPHTEIGVGTSGSKFIAWQAREQTLPGGASRQAYPTARIPNNLRKHIVSTPPAIDPTPPAIDPTPTTAPDTVQPGLRNPSDGEALFWCGYGGWKFLEESGQWEHFRCNYLVVKTEKGIEDHYRLVHGHGAPMQERGLTCAWGGECKSRRMLGSLGKHIMKRHLNGKNRLCEGKGCRRKAKEGGRWCIPTIGDHVAPIWANKEQYQVGV